MNPCDILEHFNTSQRCEVARGPLRPGCFLEKVAILSLLKGDIRINTRMALVAVANCFTEHYIYSTVPANQYGSSAPQPSKSKWCSTVPRAHLDLAVTGHQANSSGYYTGTAATTLLPLAEILTKKKTKLEGKCIWGKKIALPASRGASELKLEPPFRQLLGYQSLVLVRKPIGQRSRTDREYPGRAVFFPSSSIFILFLRRFSQIAIVCSHRHAVRRLIHIAAI